MSEWNAEKFAQRVFDVGLLDNVQVEAVWSELGSRDATLEQLTSCMLRKGLLTNLQIDRILRGDRYGFFYGKYKLLYLVGVGSFARVYRAVNIDKGDVAAVKVLRNRYMSDMAQQEHFLREAKMVMELRHPNIVPVYEVGTERERLYMVMEFVEGHNLREIIKVRKKFTPEESLRIMADVAAGLDFASTKRVTHRDLKLSNVLLTSTGRAKLVDFGLAAMAANEKERGGDKGMSQRSIDYAGLERVTGVRKDDPRSDLYFAGCMLYHLLTGVPPLVESRERSQRLSVSRFREVVPINNRDPNLPSSVVAVVNKAMELDPDRRYATPAEFLAELQTVRKRLEQGDTDQQEEDGAGGKKLLEREGEGHTLMVVESNIELQDTLRDLLKRRGYRVLIVGDARRALARFDQGERPAECVIFCTTEMAEEAVESFRAFGERPDTKDLPAILLVAEHHPQLASQVTATDRRVIIPMPLKVRQLRAALLKLLGHPSESPRG